MPKWITRKRLVIACTGFISALTLLALAEVELVLPRLFVVPHRPDGTLPKCEPEETPAKYGMRFTAFQTTARDGIKLKCWFVPALADHSSGTVIILHGWGGTKEYCRDLI